VPAPTCSSRQPTRHSKGQLKVRSAAVYRFEWQSERPPLAGQDDGPGIAPITRSHLRPFFTPEGRWHRPRSVGLEELVERHVESSRWIARRPRSHGTVFSVLLFPARLRREGSTREGGVLAMHRQCSRSGASRQRRKIYAPNNQDCAVSRTIKEAEVVEACPLSRLRLLGPRIPLPTLLPEWPPERP